MIFVLSLLTFNLLQTANTDQTQPCVSWSSLERILVHEAQQVSCNINKNCTGMSCSFHQYGYDISGSIFVYNCENPPNVLLEIDVPQLNINKWQKKFEHGDKFTLSETLGGIIDIKAEKEKYILGLILDMPSGIKANSPLLHLIPSLASKTQYQVFGNIAVYVPPCFPSYNVSQTVPVTHTQVTTPYSSPIALLSSTDKITSNCSIMNSTCTINEMCQQINKSSTEGVCTCLTDYIRNEEGKCIYNPPVSSTDTPSGPSQTDKKTSNTSLLLTAILVPITVIILAVGLVYTTIRFRIFQHLRRRLRVQVYEHVLLGQEDENDDEALNPVA